MSALIPFGARSGFQIPRVNIGAMRLPGDTDEAVALIRHAIDNGLRYIDTSRGYGDSEIKLGKALKNGYREKVILSTKWASWITKIEPSDDTSADCVLKRIEESMKRLDVDYLDYYQVWNIMNNDCYAETIRKGGFLEGVMTAKKRGLIGHTGITSHAPVVDLLRYLDEMDWCEILLVSYHLLNTDYTPVLARARQKGIGTIVMNPVGGGKLTEESPVFEPLVRKMGCRNMADLSVRYVLSNPNVDTIITGISKKSDVDDSNRSAQGPLFSAAQVAEIEAFVQARSPKNVRFCSGCGYCMPCPQGVAIPRVMDAIYNHRVLGFVQNAKGSYDGIGANSWTPGKKADECTECGACVEKCTQQIDISGEMRFARELWSGK